MRGGELGGKEPVPVAPPNCSEDEALSEEFAVDTVGRLAGAPCLVRWKAFMRAAMSDDILMPLPRERKAGGAFEGLRAALSVPSGVEEAVMLAVIAAVDADRAETCGSRRGTASPVVEGEDITDSCSGTEALGISVITRERGESYCLGLRCRTTSFKLEFAARPAE